MSTAKIVLLLVYAILIAVLVFAGGSTAATYAGYFLGLLVLVHVVEVLVFFKQCKQAGGSLPMHLLNVFLFGVLHVKELNKADQ